MDYKRGWAWQTVLLQQRLEQKRNKGNNNNSNDDDDDDAILVLEHAPVYTLGRGADETHVRFLTEPDRVQLSRTNRTASAARLAVDRAPHQQSTTTTSTAVEQLLQSLQKVSPVICPGNGAPIYRVERGGEVTFHGPGQLVVYPMLDLSSSSSSCYQQDLHWFLRQTEQVIMDALRDLGLPHATRDAEHTGVWMGDAKIAAVGVTASRWITTHGFALNVDPDLSYFGTDAILPCGIEGRGVTSLAREGVTGVTVPQVADVVLRNMERVFGIALVEGERLQ